MENLFTGKSAPFSAETLDILDGSYYYSKDSMGRIMGMGRLVKPGCPKAVWRTTREGGPLNKWPMAPSVTCSAVPNEND